MVAALVAAGVFGLVTPAVADPASDAAAVLATNSFYVSPGAASYGVTVPSSFAPSSQSLKIAVFSEDEGNAGQLARQIQDELRPTSLAPLTVAVVTVAAEGFTSFAAVSDSRKFCKGGPDIAAREALAALSDQSGQHPEMQALLSDFETRLSKLPPDNGESSCASALAHRDDDELSAWLWLIAAAVVGVIAIGGFTWYVRRTVRARGVDPIRENIPEWITEEDADDSDDEADD